jgi:hypothetical protein
MSSIVIELQKDILDSNKKTSDLLRKAYIISKKLKIVEFETWINLELNSYTERNEIPVYRKVYGQIKAWNPYHGWLPVIVTDKKTQDGLCSRKVFQSIPELEDLLIKEGSGGLAIALPDEFSNFIEIQTKVRLEINSSQIAGILEKVKNIILEWALKLENDGILGEEMSFNKDEVKKADEMKYTVNNFYGNISKSQIVQNSPETSIEFNDNSLDLEKIVHFITLVKENIESLNLPKDKIEKLTNNIIEAENNIKNGKSDYLLSSLKSIKNVLEGVASNLIASGLLYKINQLL